MPAVEYIGLKEIKTDNVANTGTVWYGAGDVQEVDDKAWAKLSRHPEVWRLAERVQVPTPQPAPAGLGLATTTTTTEQKPEQKPEDQKPDPQKPGEFALKGEDGAVIDLATFDDDKLKAFVRENKLDEHVDLRKKGDALRTSIVVAIDKLAQKA